MTALNYSAGTVSLTAGSAVVTGIDTAWATALLKGGEIFVQAPGNPLPIATIDSDTQITAALEWTGATGIYPYVLRVATTYDQQIAKNAEVFAQLRAEIEAGTIWKFDVSGVLADRDTYDTRPRHFSFLEFDEPDAWLWVKASNLEGDWAGPFSYGRGEQGIQGVQGIQGIQGTRGYKGWTIETEIVADGLRLVLRISDFIGGEGPKPSGVGLYVGNGGLVSDIADAVNIRGGTGPQGPRGVTFRGSWSASGNYAIGDIVIDDDAEGDPATYISVTANTNKKPRDNPTDWAFFPGSVPQTINDGIWGDTFTETANDGVWGA